MQSNPYSVIILATAITGAVQNEILWKCFSTDNQLAHSTNETSGVESRKLWISHHDLQKPLIWPTFQTQSF